MESIRAGTDLSCRAARIESAAGIFPRTRFSIWPPVLTRKYEARHTEPCSNQERSIISDMRKYVWIIGMLIGAGCLSQAYADTITTFDISGTVSPVSPETGTTFSGTLVIDMDFGVALSGTLNFPDLLPLDLSGVGFSSTSASIGFASSGTFPVNASLTVPTPTSFSFVGFTGGTFTSTGDQVIQFSPRETVYYDITSFTMTAETSAAPEPGSFALVLGSGSLIFMARRRRSAAGH